MNSTQRETILKGHASWLESAPKATQIRHLLFERCNACDDIRAELGGLPKWFCLLFIVFGEYVWVPLLVGGILCVATVIWAFSTVFRIW